MKMRPFFKGLGLDNWLFANLFEWIFVLLLDSYRILWKLDKKPPPAAVCCRWWTSTSYEENVLTMRIWHWKSHWKPEYENCENKGHEYRWKIFSGIIRTFKTFLNNNKWHIIFQCGFRGISVWLDFSVWFSVSYSDSDWTPWYYLLLIFPMTGRSSRNRTRGQPHQSTAWPNDWAIVDSSIMPCCL